MTQEANFLAMTQGMEYFAVLAMTKPQTLIASAATGNPLVIARQGMDCFATLAMTKARGNLYNNSQFIIIICFNDIEYYNLSAAHFNTFKIFLS